MKTYHAAIDRIATGVVSFFENTFTAVHVSGPEMKDVAALRRPLIVACTHRSQTDYFLLGRVLHGFGVKNMRFAAGENLTSLPFIGKRFRKLGAFTIRRGSTFGREYVRNLCETIVRMLHDSDTIVVFPEGGRSYRGHMMEVRSGVIGAGVLAQVRDGDCDVSYLPISISYELVPELPYFRILERGRSLRKSGQGLMRRLLGTLLYFGADLFAFTRFITAHRFGKDYGEVYVDYHEPVRVRDLIDVEEVLVPGARDDFSACRPAMQTVGLKLYDIFKSLYRVLPGHILARVLRERGEVSVAQAEPLCRELVDRLAVLGRNVASVAGLSAQALVSDGARQLGRVKAVRLRRGVISIRTQWLLRYYAAAVE